MKERSHTYRVDWVGVLSFCLPLLLFWIILYFGIPPAFSVFFQSYSAGLFLITLILYSLSFRLPNRYVILACLGLTMLLLALPLSYKWTSGFSDNFVIGGLLPYKDGKYYYLGADLILDGLPLIDANQATERPLYPSFLSSVLLLTDQNLKITLAVLVQLAGIGIYLSARQFRRSAGWLGAGLYATLLYFYIQPWVGYTMSEMFGFTMGCLGFALILSTVNAPKWQNLILAGFLLMLAVSARAGTFLIFPLLALWVGWIFRRGKWFSMKTAACALLLMLIGYFLVNSVYSRLLGIPPGNSFGNFSYAMYGQATGGTGWHSAIIDLGTRDPATVYRATWEYFLEHPISLFIGFAKSYRDFFLIGDMGIFPFGNYGIQNLPGVIMWLGTFFLLIWGLIQLVKDVYSNLCSLLVAGFIGIFLSIPFLPPIDGGSRFYAATTPFFFTLPAVGVALISQKEQKSSASQDDITSGYGIISSVSIVMIVMTLVLPLLKGAFTRPLEYIQPICPPDQTPFITEIQPDSYIDLYKKGSSQCGSAPNVCFNDFIQNNTEMVTDDFYQELFHLSDDGSIDVRIIPAMDWIEKKFHYFYVPHNILVGDISDGQMSGCAVEIETTYQSIYKVESILPEQK